MAYIPFNKDKPIWGADDGTTTAQHIRNNLTAIRDAALMGGFFGWPLAISGGTAEQPTTFIYSSGTERVRAVLTWGTTGGEDGNPVQAVYSYSSNSGADYDTIGTKTLTYDSNGNLTATSWS